MTDIESSETWLPVVGWEGLYEVSDLGRVRSIAREVQFGSRTRIAPSRILKGGLTIRGVLFVNLTNGPQRKCRSVHQLVLEAFVGPKPDDMEGCHFNDDKMDNRLSNLRWDTHAANMSDCVRNGHSHQTKKTHCPAGHEYTAENTKRQGNGRYCRECHRIDGRAKYWADIENQRILKRDAQRRRRALLKAGA